MSDFPYPVGGIQMVSFPSNTTLFKASYCASFRESSPLPKFSKANSKAQWKWSVAAAILFFHQTSRRRNQTGTRIWWFRFWILPERPFPVPLDKGNEGSGYEIAGEPISTSITLTLIGDTIIQSHAKQSCVYFTAIRSVLFVMAEQHNRERWWPAGIKSKNRRSCVCGAAGSDSHGKNWDRVWKEDVFIRELHRHLGKGKPFGYFLRLSVYCWSER